MLLYNITHMLLTQVDVVSTPTEDNWLMWLISGTKFVAQSINEKNYMPLAGFIIMLMVLFFNKFIAPRLSIPRSWSPWVSAIIGVIGSVAANFMAVISGSTQPRDWLAAIATGLTIGSAASGLWSMIGKKLVDVVGTRLTALLDKYIGKPKDQT